MLSELMKSQDIIITSGTDGMIKNRKNDLKTGIFISFYFFIMYLFTSMPAIQFSMIENTNGLFLLLGYGLTIIAAIKYRINFNNKKLLVAFLIIIIWTLAQFVFHRSYYRLSPFIILEIFAAYVIIKIYGNSIFRRFEDVTYILCIIALVGWVLLIIINPVIRNLAEIFGIPASGEKSATFILYTVNFDSYRNCGFAWEPGRTACMTCVGILFNLMRTKCNFRTVRFWIMTLCLVSTASTTGFFVFIVEVMLCYKAFNRINMVHISFILLMIVGIMSLPFMGEKIGSLLEQGNVEEMESISSALDWEVANEGSDRDYYVPQRFQGLMFSGINLLNTNFLIGDGRDFTQFFINRVNNWNVKTSEGVLEPIVQYGVMIGFFLYYLLLRVSKKISSFYTVRNQWLFFIVFVLINVSYNFWETPLFMAIWMTPVYINYFYGKSTITVSRNSLLQQC